VVTVGVAVMAEDIAAAESEEVVFIELEEVAFEPRAFARTQKVVTPIAGAVLYSESVVRRQSPLLSSKESPLQTDSVNP
jgi:hypothetical protein